MPQNDTDQTELLRRVQGWLRQKEFTRFEIRAALVRAGADPDGISSILDTLAGQALLDDRRTAWRYVLRRSARLRGPEIIRRELQERGVSADLARELVERIPDEEWRRYAARVLERHFHGEGSPRRVPLHGPGAFLRLRGFRPEDISAVLDSVEAVDQAPGC